MKKLFFIAMLFAGSLSAQSVKCGSSSMDSDINNSILNQLEQPVISVLLDGSHSYWFLCDTINGAGRNILATKAYVLTHGGVPGGNTGQIQWDSSGHFGGMPFAYWVTPKLKIQKGFYLNGNSGLYANIDMNNGAGGSDNQMEIDNDAGAQTHSHIVLAPNNLHLAYNATEFNISNTSILAISPTTLDIQSNNATYHASLDGSLLGANQIDSFPNHSGRFLIGYDKNITNGQVMQWNSSLGTYLPYTIPTPPTDSTDVGISPIYAYHVGLIRKIGIHKNLIDSVGTIISGTWQGGIIQPAYVKDTVIKNGANGINQVTRGATYIQLTAVQKHIIADSITSANTGVLQFAGGAGNISTVLLNGTTATTQAITHKGSSVATDSMVHNRLEILPHNDANDTTRQVVLKSIPDLVFNVAANRRYSFYGTVDVSCSGAGGMKFAATIPAGATMQITTFGVTSGFTAFGQGALVTSGTLDSRAFVTAGGGSKAGISFFGTITTSSTAGQFQLQFESITNLQTTTIYQEGTMCYYSLIQ